MGSTLYCQNNDRDTFPVRQSRKLRKLTVYGYIIILPQTCVDSGNKCVVSYLIKSSSFSLNFWPVVASYCVNKSHVITAPTRSRVFDPLCFLSLSELLILGVFWISIRLLGLVVTGSIDVLSSSMLNKEKFDATISLSLSQSLLATRSTVRLINPR